jgi:transcriptional regulator with PAS, ATPase and Fis domain
MNTELNWMNEVPAAITVCDITGKIIFMNDRSAEVFEKDGGKKLLGKNLFDCHTGQSAIKLTELLNNGKVNIYTIEKNNIRKMIYQSPWYSEGKYMGMVEISFEIPAEIPHFVRN